MPIQPMSIGYNPIPEAEDVSPVDGSIDRAEQKNCRTYAYAIAAITTFVVIVAILLFFIFRNPLTPFRLYQTSIEQNDFMASISTAQDMGIRGFNVGPLAFGNVHCTDEEEVKGTCSLPRYRASAITIDTSKHYQEIKGFGGAFTEAAAHNFYKLPAYIQERVLDLYFGPDGIGYTLGRIHINSCDFSLESYNFDNVDGDYDLEYFDTEVTHDNAEILPFIRAAMAKSSLPINLVASPWSPPPWMKVPQNGSDSYMTGSATPNGLIDTPEVKESWARYISKFISAYHRKGVPIWAITPQNEPEFPAPWEACAYNASFERGFIDGYLGPIVKQDHPDMLVLAFDHNKDHLAMWSEENIGSEYVDGMAFHWYTGSVDRLLDGTYGYDSVNKSHHMAPEKLLVATEGCSCPDVRLGDILRAERLAHDVMFDLNAFANGWIDWNLLVDHKGGFNHLGNNCDAPIVTTSDFSNIIVQPKYFYMGHFSKFISPGSKRVASQVRGSYRFAKMDPNVRDGMELGLFPCEQSVRQMWTYTENNTVALSMPVIDTEKPDDAPKGLCIGPGNKDRPFIHLAACDSQWAYQFDMMENGQMMELDSGKCLSVVGGVTEPGALFELSACEAGRDAEDATPSQYFYLDVTQELQTPLIEYSIAAETDALCVTAGWPFLTAAAFVNTKQETVLVVMNEASIDTEIVLSDVVKGDAWFGINARSIQTVIY